MTEMRTRRRFRPLAIGLFGALLPLALSSTAQTPAPTAAALQAATVAQSPTAPLPYRTSLPANQVLAPAAGFDVAAFESMADQLTYGNRVPGMAMAIVQGGKVLSARGYGVTDVNHPQPVDGHTVFRLASLSKAFAGTMGREVVSDMMDVIGGKGIILGPRNFAGRAWQAAPIGVTVEGANIMTRSLLIFGQGAILCHPWVLKEMQAAQDPDTRRGLEQFDQSLFGHIRFGISNAVRSFWFGLTGARLGAAPGDAYTRRFFRKLDRYSANLALMADVSMLMLGGKLKFKESLSGRLGDVLSHIYMTSAILKRYHDEGAPASDQPLLAWAFHDSVHKIETALSAALRNFPIRPVGWLMWVLIFPLGRRAEAPGDRLGHRVASLLMTPNEARDRLAKGVFLTPCANNPGGRIASYLTKAVMAEPVERKFLKALKTKGIEALDFPAQLDEAVAEGVISMEERKLLEELREIMMDTITVDDFDPHELRAASFYDKPQVQQPREAA